MQITNKHHRWLGLAIFALGLFFLGRWLFASKHIDAQPPAVLVRIAAVVRQDMPIKIQSVGSVVPYQTVAVNSRIDSQILKVHFDSGAEVKAGQLLFLLDDRVLKTQLQQADANYVRDEAQLSNLAWTHQRNEQLFAKHTISEQTFEASKAAVAAQRATVQSDKALIDDLRIQVGYARVLSPIPGRAGTLNVTAGNNVKANDVTLVTINQIKPILVQASLPQRYFDQVSKAMKAGTVSVSAMRDRGLEVGQGTLQYINNSIDQNTGTFVVRALFENAEELLWPGMLVQLTLHLGNDKQVIVVPVVAIQHNNSSGEFVFVINNHRAQKRPVTLSRTQQGMAIIQAGLKEKEQVAIDGLMSLKPGTLVQIQAEGQHGHL